MFRYLTTCLGLDLRLSSQAASFYPSGFGPDVPSSASRNIFGRFPEAAVVKGLTALFFASIFAILCVPFFSHLPWTTLVQDDFFYYLVVAQNIAHGHGSTFNGIVATNGYHPLWLLLLTGLSFITTDPHLILGFVALSIFAASLATFLLARRMLAHAGVRPLLAFGLAAWITAFSFTIFCDGMEVTLTIPLIFGVLACLQQVDWLARSPKHTFYLGLLLAAMVLSRLDTFILGGLLLLGILVSPGLHKLLRWRLIAGGLLGLSPIVFYLAVNRALFHLWLPVSGDAKQLKLDGHPSPLPLHFLLSRPSYWAIFVFLVVFLSFFVFSGRLARLSSMERTLFLAAVVFPFVYYVVLSLASDWPLWPWYLYALRPAVFVCVLMACHSLRHTRPMQSPVLAAVLIVTVFGYVIHHGWGRQQLDINYSASHVQQFADTHPGIYAMGDRSGQVAYMLPYPLVQVEGLMMDRAYLDLVRHQVPLRDVLARYNVRYYVATSYHPAACFEAVEPYQGGVHSAHLRAEFCDPPVADFSYGGKHTLIFDLDTASNAQAPISPGL